MKNQKQCLVQLQQYNSPSLKLRRTKKGSVLVFALIVLSFILLAAFSLASISLIERRSADISVNSSTAFQNSDKGMEEFLQQLYKDLDQNDDLNDVTSAINNIYGSGTYACVDGAASPNAFPARIGDLDTEFIISAYRESTTSGVQGQGGWNAVDPITECATALADVSRFKVTGNYHNAARAVFLKLRDSLTRGLVAHWSFEDRAQNARLANTADKRNSFMAGDSSKNNYVLTLCQVYDDTDPADISVEGVDEDGNPKPYHLVSFDACDKPNKNPGGAMNPFKYKDGHCIPSDGCTDDGAWREGIVQENNTGGATGVFGDDATEALYFDGNDYLTALTDSGDCDTSGCDSTINYVDDKDAERLDLTDGMAISAWIKRDRETPKQTIVSKWKKNDEGYRFGIINRMRLCLWLNDELFCKDLASSHYIDAGVWAHVVAVWRKDDGGVVQIYVNGEEVPNNESYNYDIDTPSDTPLSVGAWLDNGVAKDFFEGSIDDVRVWKRALTGCEIERLCNDGVMNQSGSDIPLCGTGLCTP